MIAKAYRITDRNVFRRVQRIGEVYQSENFGIAYLKREDTNPSKFAFVISSKISKEAIDRNTIKRHMSEAIRIMVKEIKDGMDIVFLAKPNILRIPADVLVREIRTAVKEGGFLK